jgi:hypothetical protein
MDKDVQFRSVGQVAKQRTLIAAGSPGAPSRGDRAFALERLRLCDQRTHRGPLEILSWSIDSSLVHWVIRSR